MHEKLQAVIASFVKASSKGSVVSSVAGFGEESQKTRQFLAFYAKWGTFWATSLSENSKRQLLTKVAKPSRSGGGDETFNINRKPQGGTHAFQNEADEGRKKSSRTNY